MLLIFTPDTGFRCVGRVGDLGCEASRARNLEPVTEQAYTQVLDGRYHGTSAGAELKGGF
jgi:hypothetical protein